MSQFLSVFTVSQNFHSFDKGAHRTGLCLASTIDTRIGMAIIMRHLALYPYNGGKQHIFSV